MGLRFTVLASGSGGNATLVETADFGVLIDIGLGPRQLTERLSKAGLSWASVQAVLLTHTHADHWKDRTLGHLHRHGIPLYCHPQHDINLRASAPAYEGLHQAGLVRLYQAGQELDLAPTLRGRVLWVSHDGGPTFGFRLESRGDLFGQNSALGYVADLGCWDEKLAAALADVDLLAVEFNHDEALERASSRGAQLIARVLGDEGHLSNLQAADLVRAVLARSPAGRLRHLVQLHLSRECNRPALARQAAHSALEGSAAAVEVHTAEQDQPGTTLHVHFTPSRHRRRTGRSPRPRSQPAFIQAWLPGMELGATRENEVLPRQ